LSADIDIVYDLDGTGSARRLLLSGCFPLLTPNDEEASFPTCDVTITADAVDQDTARGTVAGTFSASASTIPCTINSGEATLLR
jgi:hypothetical protein